MDPAKLRARLQRGSFGNVRFSDACALAEAFGFEHVRTRGSHEVYRHPDVPRFLNLQNARGEAKPYQLRELLRLARLYALTLEVEP